ncbi:MAG: ATP-dependent Clp protease proteolytic subunit, partial [Erysipelotrichaceae bacterium]|nr:ATP-dependent Clp protease proteolytic subunit [Erysipelotrichaceae bacterium]
TVMIHQPLGNMQGKVSDLENTARHFLNIKKTTIDLIHQTTHQNQEKIAKDIENDTYLTAEEALEYGIADHILPAK